MNVRDMIDNITDFIFVENEPVKADIIFVPGGSWPEPAERAASLWLDGYAPIIMPSGKYSIKRGYFPGLQTKADVYGGSFETESEFLASVMVKAGVKPDVIIQESEAQTTIENAIMSRKIADKYNLSIRKAIICCKAFHARRSAMLYAWAFPECEFTVCPVETQGVNRNNWFTNSYGIERIMGELSRCGAQLKETIPVFDRQS